MNPQPKTLIKNLTFTEGPWWKDGRLYFSGFFTYRVYATGINSSIEQRAWRIKYLKADVPGARTP